MDHQNVIMIELMFGLRKRGDIRVEILALHRV